MSSVIKSEEVFAKVDPSQKILLLPQCLRPSETCRGKFTRQGLQCPDDCHDTCIIRQLREVALEQGYRAVCIAAGGAMALRTIRTHNPKGILAVACEKELEMGLEGVEKLSQGSEKMPVVVVIPLLRDGCVDTEVDVDRVVGAINLRPSDPAAQT